MTKIGAVGNRVFLDNVYLMSFFGGMGAEIHIIGLTLCSSLWSWVAGDRGNSPSTLPDYCE